MCVGAVLARLEASERLGREHGHLSQLGPVRRLAGAIEGRDAVYFTARSGEGGGFGVMG